MQACFPSMRATFVRNARASVLLGMWVHVCWYCVVYKERWALISFSDICVLTCYFICGYALTIPPPHAHAPPLLPSGATSPVSSSSGHNHRGGTPPLDHGRAVATPKLDAQQRQLGHDHWGGTPPLNHGRAMSTLTIGTRQHLLWLTLFSPLAFVCTTETLHLSFHPHNTLTCNHPPPHTHTHTACQHT